MFDDQLNSQSVPPTNLPTEPVDMFAETEEKASAIPPAPDALSVGMLKKKDTVPNLETEINPMANTPVYAMKEPILGKILLSIVLILLLVGLGFGGWWFYSNYFNDAGANNQTKTNNTVETGVSDDGAMTNEEVLTTPTNTAATNTESLPSEEEMNRDINNDKILFGEPIDSDKDGLDDVREKEIGTDPQKSDTDGDGLIDGDEVIIWKTNPLLADTDGDSHADGKEVKNGYNPLGPGKLLNVQSSVASSTASTSTTSTK